MKKFFKIVSVFLILFLVTGCNIMSFLEQGEKNYSLKDGLHVKMGDDFEEKTNANFNSYLEGGHYIFTSLKESFEIAEGVGLTKDSPLNEYVKIVLSNNGLDKDIIEKDGLTYFTYDSTIDGTKYYYMAFAYKTNDAFWLINFACLDSEKSTYESKFIKWAKSIWFES